MREVQGSGFRVQGSGFRVQGSGFRVQGPTLLSEVMSEFAKPPIAFDPAGGEQVCSFANTTTITPAREIRRGVRALTACNRPEGRYYARAQILNAHILPHTMCQSNGFRKSTPPHNRQLIVYCY